MIKTRDSAKAMKKPNCSFCGRAGHTSIVCYEKPKAKINKGKHEKQWIVTRRTWFRKNPAEHYNCFYCDKRLFPNQVTLDHKLSRSRHPELRYKLDNLVSACWNCNKNKSSKDYDKL